MKIEKKFGPFQFAAPKTRLVTANIERHLDDMIPGYRDPSQRPLVVQNDDVDPNFALAAPNELLQQGLDILDNFRPQNPVKREPNDDRNGEHDDVTSSGLGPSDATVQNNHLAETLASVQEYSKVVQEEHNTLKKKVETQRQKIKHLENELQKKDQQLAESDAKLVDAKKKQWCSDCAKEVETEHPPMCTNCSLMNWIKINRWQNVDNETFSNLIIKILLF